MTDCTLLQSRFWWSGTAAASWNNLGSQEASIVAEVHGQRVAGGAWLAAFDSTPVNVPIHIDGHMRCEGGTGRAYGRLGRPGRGLQ